MEHFHQLSGIISCCLRGPLSGPELNVVDYVEHAVGSGRFHNFQLFESTDSPWRRVGNYESDHFRMHAQHSPQHQSSLLDTTFSSGPDNGPRRQQLSMPLSW